MMEVQEDEEEAPDKRQGYTYNHTYPRTTPQHKQDPTELSEPAPICGKCRLCSCTGCPAAEDHMDEPEDGPSNTDAHHHQPSLRRSTRPHKPQITPTDQCSWRQSQEQGSFCLRSCQGHQSAPEKGIYILEQTSGRGAVHNF